MNLPPLLGAADHLSFLAQDALDKAAPDYEAQLDAVLAAHALCCAAHYARPHDDAAGMDVMWRALTQLAEEHEHQASAWNDNDETEQGAYHAGLAAIARAALAAAKGVN